LNMIALMDRFTRGRTNATGARMAGLLSSVVPAKTSGGGILTGETRARGAAGGQS